MNLENLNGWSWIILIIVGIICAIIGYIMGKGKFAAPDQSAELTSLRSKNDKLEADLLTCNQKLTEMNAAPIPSNAITPPPMTKAATANNSIPFSATAAKAALGKSIKENDLKVVEGIGPKIQLLFHSSDITTWQALSESSVSKCQEVLLSGGDRYKIHDPSSWPLQAKMAYEGKWKELQRWQDEHKRGKL
ncbi:hypothetical protein SAMN04487911_104129 [Arenibacter nanhaiticus]|uniref:Uncharacterized protein n=1 Tax=Arenibacter nanhaiticus TaxID=558155 RepID=A0A1M6D183_9FLAO|nr:hypothetical protein [Arenibacter nanhaiticus]SHI67042.1 hypothetical protein SAMN04487911_104129 [Arenibacter nanhaiticus]